MSEKYSQPGPLYDLANLVDKSKTNPLMAVTDRDCYCLWNGNAFAAAALFTGVADGGKVNTVHTVGDDPVFVTYSIVASQACTFGVAPAPGDLAGGTPINVFKRNGLVDNDPGMTVKKGATYSAITGQFVPRLLPGSIGGVPQGGASQGSSHISFSAILPPGTVHVTEVTNISEVDNAYINIVLEWNVIK